MLCAVKFRRLKKKKILIQLFHPEVFLKAYKSFLILNLCSKASASVSVCHCEKELKSCRAKILGWCFFFFLPNHIFFHVTPWTSSLKGRVRKNTFCILYTPMDLSVPGWKWGYLLIHLRDQLQIYPNVAHLFLIFLFLYLYTWVWVSCCQDLHSLALVKVKIQSLCVDSKPLQICDHPLVWCI